MRKVDMQGVNVRVFLAALSAMVISTTGVAALDRSRFNVGAYRFGPALRDEAHVLELKEAGVDFVCSVRPGKDAKAFYGFLDLLDRHGIGCITEGGTEIGAAVPVGAGRRGCLREKNPPELYERNARRFRTHPALWGLDVCDEPSAVDMEYLGEVVEQVRRLHPNQFPYVNLFPSYARVATNSASIVDSQLGARSYGEYIDTYCRTVPLDYISFDLYPYSKSEPNGIPLAYDNFRQVANACVEHGKSLWFVGQVNSWWNLPPLSANQLRWQAYTAMTFGAEVMTWACWNPGWWTNNVYTAEGVRTEQYEKVKTVNRELHRLGAEYMRFRRVATHFVGFDGKCAAYLRNSGFVSSKSVDVAGFKTVAAVDGLALTIGEMLPRKPASATSAMLVVAAEDPYDRAPRIRKVRFVSTGAKLRAVDGSGAVKLDRGADGSYSFEIKSNHAVLVINEEADVELPGEDGTKTPITYAPFPDRMSAYVWRNWFLVPTERLANSVGATCEQLTAIATEMGLPAKPEVLPEWRRKGYITVVRRNWHLLPYEQLLKVTDMTRKELRFSLLEEDFLWSKLGCAKPKCGWLVYDAAKAAATRSARLKIGKILKSEGIGDFAEEPRFAFVKEISKCASDVAPAKSADSPFEFRMISSYFADYADSLGDDEIGSYPEGLLQKLSVDGVNAIWLHVVLNTLVKDPKYPEFGEGCERRIANLNRLVDRAAKYGMKVFIYVNEPRGQPPSFFTGERQEFRGQVQPDGTRAAMCTSHPEPLRWASDALEEVFRSVPGLGGMFMITWSENLTHCASRGRKHECPRCANRSDADIIAEVNAALIAGMKRGNPKARAIIWNWQWPDALEEEVIGRLPKDCTLMCVSEDAMVFERGGVTNRVADYSISVVGPSEKSLRNWKLAKDRGLSTCAKVQASCTWELSCFPYLPVGELVAEHAKKLSSMGVKDIMLSWSLGCAPAPNLSLFSNPDLDALARKLYGDAAVGAARRSWHAFADGYREFPFHIVTAYFGPQHWGPANPLYRKPTGWNSSMVGIPADDLTRWRGGYPAETWIAQMDKVANGFNEGCRLFDEVVAKCDDGCRAFAEKEARMFRAEALHFRSSANQARYVLARERGDRQAMASCVAAELASAREMLPLCRADSRIGYECSNHYFYTPQDLREKVIACRLQLDELIEEELSFVPGFTMTFGQAADKAPAFSVGSSEMRTCDLSIDGARRIVTWHGHERCGESFAVTAIFEPKDGGWEYSMRYDGCEAGLDVEEIAFPELEVPRTDRTRIVIPRQTGEVRLPDWNRLKPGATITSRGPMFVGFHLMSSLDDEVGGWYIDQRGDARLRACKFVFANGERPDTVKLSARYIAEAKAEFRRAGELPFRGLVKSFRGGWYKVAETYRDWVSTQDWYRQAKSRNFGKLRDVALWMWNRGRSEEVAPQVERFMEETGLPAALDWYWWHEIPYDTAYPFFWPPREPVETFVSTVARLREKGAYVQTYTNGMLWDRSDSRWNADGEREVLRQRNGSAKTQVFNPYTQADTAWMCGNAPRFQEKLRSVERKLALCGLDGVYMDMIANCACCDCWSEEHGHVRGGGRAVADGYRKLLAAVRKDNPGLQLSSEEEGEAFIELLDSLIVLYGCYERMGCGTAPVVEMPPIFEAIYHGTVTMFGSYSVIDGITPWDEKWGTRPPIDEAKWAGCFPDQFACEFARGVVQGVQPCVHKVLMSHMTDPKWAADWKFVKDTARFYYDNRKYLFDGEMRDPGEMKCDRTSVDFFIRGCYTKEDKFRSCHQNALPAVFHSVWRANDGTVAAVVVNRTRQPRDFELTAPEISAKGTLPPLSWRLLK